VQALALNVTVTEPAAGGYVTAGVSGTSGPLAFSTLNFTAGQTIANASTASPLKDGIVLYNGSGGPTQLLVDAFGYYS
jgi:hypothetical protein